MNCRDPVSSRYVATAASTGAMAVKTRQGHDQAQRTFSLSVTGLWASTVDKVALWQVSLLVLQLSPANHQTTTAPNSATALTTLHIITWSVIRLGSSTATCHLASRTVRNLEALNDVGSQTEP